MDYRAIFFERNHQGLHIKLIKADPYELKNLFGASQAAEAQQRLMAALMRWTIRTQDDLPNAAYTAKRPEHNWCEPYRR